MKYRICFQEVYLNGDTKDKTKEFSAPNKPAALKIYEDFCCQASDSSIPFISAYPMDVCTYPTGLFRIIQREITRRVS